MSLEEEESLEHTLLVANHRLKVDPVLEDHIGKLPAEILGSILSRLPLREAVGTSILSSQWRRHWTLTTCLNFDFMKTFERIRWKPELHKTERHNFVKWVNRVLELHVAGPIEEFKVCFSLDKRFKFDIDEWIKYALSMKVQRLELDLSSCIEKNKVYTFPCELFGQSEETCFSSRFSIMANRMSMLVGVKSLKEVCLKHQNVSDEVVEFLQCNCPVLERLSIHCSFSFVNLKVGGPLCALKHLEIVDCCGIKSIEISDANLVSFSYLGVKTNLLLENVPSLVDVCIGGYMIKSYFDSSLNGSFAQLSCCLKTLTLEIDDAWGMVRPRALPKLTALKQLTVEITVWDDFDLLRYASLVEMSPNLQKFVLKASWDSLLLLGNTKDIRHRKCPHRCLKEVKLGGYYSRRSDLEVAVYFFENAVALEKIIIDPRDQSPFAKSLGTKRNRPSKSRAKQQLEGMVPAGVELLIL